MSPDYLGALLIGLLGSGHCLGMCGGISGLLSLNQTHHSLKLLIFYNLGRLLSYAIIGGIIGGLTFSLTALVDMQSTLIGLRFFAALLMIALGLYIGRWWFGLLQFEKIGQKIWPKIAPLGKSLLPLKKQWHALPFGLVWGWLPCGLVYSMLTWSAVTGTFTQGALIMFSFGLGTLPIMLSSGLSANKLIRLQQSIYFRQFAAVLIISYGIYTAYSAIMLINNLN